MDNGDNGASPSGTLEGYHTVSRPREIDPTNLRVETVRGAMVVDQAAWSGGRKWGVLSVAFSYSREMLMEMLELTVDCGVDVAKLDNPCHDISALILNALIII